jgi:hypothetical protein
MSRWGEAAALRAFWVESQKGKEEREKKRGKKGHGL